MNIKEVLERKQELYSISFEQNVNFEFRLLKIREFNLFSKLLVGGNILPFFVYEEIFNVCYIGNVEFLNNKVPVGYIVSTGNLIYEMSGGDNGQNFLLKIAQAREEALPNSLYEHMKTVVFMAFKSISLKDIDEMTEREFIRYFVSAENLLSKTVNGYKMIDLKAIYDEMYNFDAKPREVKESIAVENNQYLEKELGYWEVKEAEERFLKEEYAKVKALAQNKG